MTKTALSENDPTKEFLHLAYLCNSKGFNYKNDENEVVIFFRVLKNAIKST